MPQVITKERSALHFAERMSRLGTETAFEVLGRARQLEAQGRSVIHLEIGEPDFDTPPNITDAAIVALKQKYTHYTPAAGLPEVREAVARYVAKTRKAPVSADQVVITPGAKPIITFSLLALIDAGDEVIYPNPGFPIYESVIRFCNGRPVPIRLREERNFRLDSQELADLVTDRTKMIIVNSPENPTGSVLTRRDVEEICEIVRERDIWIFSDEIYSRDLYGGEYTSPYSFPDMPERTIIMDGMSKAYAMTGWRLGYGVMPKELALQVTRLQINCTSCTAAFSQRAIIEALEGPQESVAAMAAEFKRRRDVIVKGLNAIPRLSCQNPDGAFYVFPNVSQIGWPSKKLADFLLEEAGVACLTGTSFGEFGEGYLRFSYANSIENIQEGLRRVESALKKL